MNKKNINALTKARAYAFLLLKFRLRSEKELYRRLKQKKFDEEIIKQTLSFLKDKSFIDDNSFARAWIASRIKRPLDLRRIKQELNLKGIDKDIINREISAIKNNYSEADIVKNIAQERLGKLKGIDPQKARRRLYTYLLRRGFSPEVIIDTLS